MDNPVLPEFLHYDIYRDFCSLTEELNTSIMGRRLDYCATCESDYCNGAIKSFSYAFLDGLAVIMTTYFNA